jgi:hypothetical protein
MNGKTTNVICFLQNGSAFTVPRQGPGSLHIIELRDAQLAGESTVGPVEDILGGDGDGGVGKLARQRQVDRRGRDDDLGIGIAVTLVQMLDDGGDGVLGSIPGVWSVIGTDQEV